MKRVVIVDNYDSFTYNLAQALEVLGAEMVVRTSDNIGTADVVEIDPTHLVISPGPGRPEDAGGSMEMIEVFARRIPILGVCLGHQAIAAVFGGRIGRARSLMHGKGSPIHHDGRTLFKGLPNPLSGGRYHSLAVTEIPPILEVSAHSADGEIMGLRHRLFPVEGVQFHPESILTSVGEQLLGQFLELEAPIGSMVAS